MFGRLPLTMTKNLLSFKRASLSASDDTRKSRVRGVLGERRPGQAQVVVPVPGSKDVQPEQQSTPVE